MNIIGIYSRGHLTIFHAWIEVLKNSESTGTSERERARGKLLLKDTKRVLNMLKSLTRYSARVFRGSVAFFMSQIL